MTHTAAAIGNFAPVTARERIVVLDVLRGFALLGIFLMNIEWFSRPMQEMGHGIDPAAGGPDYWSAWAVYAFVQGKFWVLFSLLFGMGFVVMSTRGAQSGGFNRTYLRRCLVLLGFGVAHALLMWPGDILHAYAVAGLVLLAFATAGSRALFWTGLLGYLAMAAFILFNGVVLSFVSFEAIGMGDYLGQMEADAARAATVYSDGSFLEATAQRARDLATLIVQGDMLVVPMAFSVFLLGAWLVRSGRIDDIAAQRPFFVRMALLCLPAGLLLTAGGLALGVSFTNDELGRAAVAMSVMSLGALPLSLGYMALVVLGMGVPGLSRVLSWLAPAGRMALTNYLMQSLVASLLFFGYGFGLWGQVGRAGQVGIVLAVFVAQVVLSRWWLSRFRFGPLEWLWRWLTYGRRPAMRIVAAG